VEGIANLREVKYNTAMAGMGTDNQKSAAHATTPIATAFKTLISHRKNGLLNRLPAKVSFSIFD
jgi:hypothetical protein